MTNPDAKGLLRGVIRTMKVRERTKLVSSAMSELSTHYLEQFAACDGHKGERGSRRDERTPANASTRGRTGKGASNRELTSLEHAGLTHGAPVVARYESTEGSGEVVSTDGEESATLCKAEGYTLQRQPPCLEHRAYRIRQEISARAG